MKITLFLLLLCSNLWSQIVSLTKDHNGQKPVASIRIEKISSVHIEKSSVILVADGIKFTVTPADIYFTSIETFAQPLNKQNPQILFDFFDGVLKQKKVKKEPKDRGAFFSNARKAVEKWKKTKDLGKLSFDERFAMMNLIKDAYRLLIDQQSESLSINIDSIIVSKAD